MASHTLNVSYPLQMILAHPYNLMDMIDVMQSGGCDSSLKKATVICVKQIK